MKFDKLEKIVIPDRAVMQAMGNQLKTMDSRFHGNDDKVNPSLFTNPFSFSSLIFPPTKYFFKK